MGDDESELFHEPSPLLKEPTKEPLTDTKAAFPVFDAFKSNPTLTADDLKDRVEFDTSEGRGIHEAVREALQNLHKKNTEKQPAKKSTKPVHKPETHIDASKIINAVVSRELANYHVKTALNPSENSDTQNAEMDDSLRSKLEEISTAEKKLLTLLSEMKNFLMKKEHGSDDASFFDDNYENIEDVLRSRDNFKRSFIPTPELPDLEEFRRNNSLVDKFIDEAIPDDGEDDDNDQPIQGDARDLLGKKEMHEALLKKAVPGEIDDVPLSKLEEESDDNDSVASDRGITRDNLVESPFSVLDYKKTGKKSRHMVS